MSILVLLTPVHSGPSIKVEQMNELMNEDPVSSDGTIR